MREIGWYLLPLMGLSLLLFRSGVSLHGFRCATPMALVTVVAVLIDLAVVHGNSLPAGIVPLPAILALGVCLPLETSLLAGIVYGQRSAPRRRRTIWAFLILTAGWGSVASEFVSPAIPRGSHFRNGVCLQSSPTTCSPSCAVTLLDCYGIRSNEQEMTMLCRTGNRGTSLLGLYRGLKLKTEPTNWDVEIVRCPLAELRSQSVWPIILPIRLEAFEPPIGQRFALLKNLVAGQHCVVLFWFTPTGRAVLGDPAHQREGYVEWSEKELERRWLGEGIRLVERGRSSAAANSAT